MAATSPAAKTPGQPLTRPNSSQRTRPRTKVTARGCTTGLMPVPAVNFVRGRILCDEFGRVTGWPGVFAAGDVAAIPDAHRTPYPPTVTFAIATGESVGINVLATLRGEPLRRIEHESGAQVGIMSRRYAVAQIRGWAVQGRLGVLAGRL